MNSSNEAGLESPAMHTKSNPLTEQQIRETVARMEAESAAAPQARRGPKTTLLNLALAGNPGALFVIYSNALRYGVVVEVA